ncbi:hypothetical protein TKK_0009897 [Trichogramma kaykai]
MNNAPDLNRLFEVYPQFIETENMKTIINKEWNLLSTTNLNSEITRKKNIDDFWITLADFEYTHGNKCFQNLCEFVQNILLLPNSNASAERLWSKYNLEKTKLRNRLHFETMKNLLFTSQLATYIREIDEPYELSEDLIARIINAKSWKPRKTPSIKLKDTSDNIFEEHSYSLNLKKKYVEEDTNFKKRRQPKVNYLNKPVQTKRVNDSSLVDILQQHIQEYELNQNPPVNDEPLALGFELHEGIGSSTIDEKNHSEYIPDESLPSVECSKTESIKMNSNADKKHLVKDFNFCGMNAPNMDKLKVPCKNKNKIIKETLCDICGLEFMHLKRHVDTAHSTHPNKGSMLEKLELNKNAMLAAADAATEGFDTLIIDYGNELTSKLRGIQHRANIITQLRRLGRLKLILKVNQLADMFFNDSTLVVCAIEKMAEPILGVDENQYLKYLTVARNLNTIVKSICDTYESKCIKKIVNIDSNITSDWKKTYVRDFSVLLSRMARESKTHNNRHKDYGLPEEGDPERLHEYLSENLKKTYTSLKENYSKTEHLKFLKLILTYLQIYNRCRPGDVERIYLEDYLNLQTISEVEKSEFATLNENLQDLAKEFSILKTRGKLNRDIKFLVTYDLKIYLDLFVELRPKLDISPKNNLVEEPESHQHLPQITQKRTSNEDLNDQPKKKLRWTDNIINIILKTFPGYMNKKSDKAPSAEAIREMIEKNPRAFSGRTGPAVKTWMYLNRGKH